MKEFTNVMVQPRSKTVHVWLRQKTTRVLRLSRWWTHSTHASELCAFMDDECILHIPHAFYYGSSWLGCQSS